MELEIKKVIITELIKKQGGMPTIFIPDDELDSEDKDLIKVMNILDESFTKKTEKKAKFSEDGFKPLIKSFFQNDIDFYELTKNLTIKLKDIVYGVTGATGGYIVFCLCKKKCEFLSIFIIRNTESATLQRNGNNWDIDTVVHLDTKNFAMGSKINLSIYMDENNHERYISFIRGNTDISQYFEQWIGIEEERSALKDVNSLIDIIVNIDLPNDIEDSIEFKQAIFNYVKGSGKNLINIRELSKHFYEDEYIISKYAEKHDIDIDGEFKVNSRLLSKFYKISSKVNGISLQAPLNKFSGNEKAIEVVDNKVIIYSKNMAENIQKQINNSEYES